jgi:DNA-binding NarL/FixJ family response regulator
MRIFLVDDHAIVRRGLVQLIAGEADLSVCGEAESVDEAMAAMEAAAPDLVVVDIILKGSNGIDLIAMLRDEYPEVKMLVLSMHTEVGVAERALRAGARGYVTKQDADEELIGALRKVAAGGMYVPPYMSERLLESLVKTQETTFEERLASLSERERAVFVCMGAGKDTKEIAGELGLNLKTVETYRRRLRAKLDIDSTSKLSFKAFEHFHQQPEV